LNDLSSVVAEIQGDADKVENGKRGQNAAGTRVRKAMQEVKRIANDVRVAVTDIRNERKGA